MRRRGIVTKPPCALDPAKMGRYFSRQQPCKRQHAERGAQFAPATRLLRAASQRLKGFGECLAGAGIHDALKIDLLPLLQVVQSGALDSVALHVHIESAVNWPDVSVAFPRVEPFYGSCSHRDASRGYLISQ